MRVGLDRARSLTTRLIILIGIVLTGLALSQVARADDPRAAGGMLDWSNDEMVRALGIFVPDRMKTFEVSGVALAIVSNGKIVYAGTFGKANKDAKIPVTPSTLFDAGELGETVAAYGAISMVDDKRLFLDAPLSRDLAKPWLSNADDDAKITLRDVLTHRSGLGDNVAHPSRATDFATGTRFAHSGVGFLYLQYVMESLSGRSFDEVMRVRVFKPIGMDASGYVTTPADRGQMAQGYVPLSFVLTVFYLPFVISFAIILAAVWAISWFMLRRRIDSVDFVWPSLGATVFAMAIVWWGLGLAPAVFVIGVALVCALVAIMLGAFAYYLLYIVGLARVRDGIIARGGNGRESMIVLLAVVIALVGFLPALNWSVPVKRFSVLQGPPVANVASTFHTTAPDMARFMIDVMEGNRFGPALKDRVLNERVEVGAPFYWSLISGVRIDGAKETFWTRGSVMGFESLMVMDPARRAGVVVLTNSRSGGELAQDIVRNVLGVEAVWSLP